jgi:hypothetical protein
MNMGKTTPKWEVGYKEVKNVIHNDMGLTREDIQNIVRQIAREEIAVTIGKNGEFIRHAMKDIIRDEMAIAINADGYPTVGANTFMYSSMERNPFHKFVSGILKQEIINSMREQFDVGVQITPKQAIAPKEDVL